MRPPVCPFLLVVGDVFVMLTANIQSIYSCRSWKFYSCKLAKPSFRCSISSLGRIHCSGFMFVFRKCVSSLDCLESNLFCDSLSATSDLCIVAIEQENSLLHIWIVHCRYRCKISLSTITGIDHFKSFGSIIYILCIAQAVVAEDSFICVPSGISDIFYTLWIPLLAFETLLCALSVIRALQVLQVGSSFSKNSLMYILIRDSALYYIV